MGNLVSKCCKTEGKKYAEEQNGKGTAIQPEQDDPVRKVAINSGATQEVPNTNYEKNEPVDDDIRKHDYRDDTEKANQKHKKQKKKDDSSDSWTSSSSDSSKSDSDTEYMKSSKKVYKNKGGGTTYISSKTIYGGHKMNIGKNARNLTINIGSNSGAPTAAKKSPAKEAKTNTRPFQNYYNESRAYEEETRQYTSPWGQSMAPPGGNFIDTRDHHVKEYVFESSVQVQAACWVCMIRFPRGSGTGFRVGSKYIMTAKHVVDAILEPGYQQVGQPEQGPTSRLQDLGVYAVFNYLNEGQISDRHKFYFKDIVHFSDGPTDTAVLELKANPFGTVIPLSFTYFSLPSLNNRFYFIGHSEGKRMQFNRVDKTIDKDNADTRRDIIEVKRSSLEHTGKDYECPPDNTLLNPNRFLFHCKFMKGASGSPGVVVLEDGRVVVVTMLLCGFPDWYYDVNVPDDTKNTWPKTHCVEQGVNFKSVYERMLTFNRDLCLEIFTGHTDSIPDPSINASIPSPNI